jgi:hypothetical protein
MTGRNLDRRTVDEINAAEDESAGPSWRCSLRAAAGRIVDELVMGLAVCSMSVYAHPGRYSADRADSAESRAVDPPERAGSVGLNLALVGVASEARTLLGDRASEWMVTPNRMLDGMTPAELATSPEGARVVLHELRRFSSQIQATTGSRARGPKSTSILGAGLLARYAGRRGHDGIRGSQSLSARLGQAGPERAAAIVRVPARMGLE